MRRLDSESRLPGMRSQRRCIECNEPLEFFEFDRCSFCLPALSEHARAVGAARRHEREQVERAKRNIKNVEGLMRKLMRRL